MHIAEAAPVRITLVEEAAGVSEPPPGHVLEELEAHARRLELFARVAPNGKGLKSIRYKHT